MRLNLALEAGARRDREIDELAAAFRQQGEAMTQAFTRQGTALDRQGDVLAELLRRPPSRPGWAD